MTKRRVDLNIPQDLVNRIDAYADRLCINRTSAMLVLITQALDAQDTQATLATLVAELQRVGAVPRNPVPAGSPRSAQAPLEQLPGQTYITDFLDPV